MTREEFMEQVTKAVNSAVVDMSWCVEERKERLLEYCQYCQLGAPSGALGELGKRLKRAKSNEEMVAVVMEYLRPRMHGQLEAALRTAEFAWRQNERQAQPDVGLGAFILTVYWEARLNMRSASSALYVKSSVEALAYVKALNREDDLLTGSGGE
jgi:hypothetical protein